MKLNLPLRDLTWLAPFAFLGLVALMPARPPSALPPPAQSRIVTDTQGTKVAIPLPFKTIRGNDFLEVTHAPEALFKIGGPGNRIGFAATPMSRYYPQLVKNDALWDSPDDIETLLAHADGVTFFFGSPPALWKRLGIPVLATGVDEDHIFAVTSLANAARGDMARGEALIADYRQAFADLAQELRPETLTNLPRVMSMGSSTTDWSDTRIWVGSPDDNRIVGVRDATIGFAVIGRQQEAERILAMNPDIIFTSRESVDAFLHDPRWQGLKAVLNKRVYGGGSGFSPGWPSWSIDENPLNARLTAEIVHPDRLQPKIRAIARAHFLKAYGYRLSDDEIDTMLGVEEQKNVPGFTRFKRDNEVRASSTDDK